MKQLIAGIVLISLVGCTVETETELPHTVTNGKIEKIVVYNDYNQHSNSQTTLSKIKFDDHTFILVRGEYGEDFGTIIHHPDCYCR